jgi:hypothetical protein
VIFFLLQLVLFQMKMFNLHIKCHGLCSCSLFALFCSSKLTLGLKVRYIFEQSTWLAL